MARLPTVADYGNPVYVEMVADGLRRRIGFDPVRHWVDPQGRLHFENAAGFELVFAPLSGIERPAAYVPGDELIDE